MTARPKVLQFDVQVDASGDARSGLGGTAIPHEPEWWAEHLVLAGLVRCTLASMDHAARRAGLEALGWGSAHATVTKRDDDGLHAFVDIETRLEIDLNPVPEPAVVRNLVGKAEYGCFVSNSLTAKPRHRWTVNGEKLS